MEPTQIEITGTNPGSFPVLETWEWPVAAYLFLGGLVAGLLIFGATMRLRKVKGFERAIRVADLAAIPLLALGLIFLWIDLSNRWNAWRFFTTFRPRSAMSWGSWILALSMVALGFRLALHIDAWERWVPSWLRKPAHRIAALAEGRLRLLDGITIVLGIALGLYTGVLLSSISARPLWDSVFLAPLFLVSGMASGGAFLCLFLKEDAHRRLAPVSMSLCGVEVALIGAYLVTLAAGSAPAQRAADLLLGGDFTAAFWLVVVVVGLALPLMIEVGEIRRWLSARIARVAPVLKLTGAAGLRFVILFAGLETVL